MPSFSSLYSSQARPNYLFYRLSQAVILALFISGVTATGSGEGGPTTNAVAESSQTLDHHFSGGHTLLSSVTTEPIQATATVVDDHGAQANFKVAASSDRKMPDQSSVLVPEATIEPKARDSVVDLTGNPAKIIEIDEDSCPDGYDEILDDKRSFPEEGEVILAGENGTPTGTDAPGVEQATIKKNATNHPPVMNDVPIDPLDHSFHETVQEVIAESNTSEEKGMLEDFLTELFEEPEGGSPPDPVQKESPKPLTEEQIAERKRLLEIETREKRIEITGRHAQWETRLEDRGKEILAELLKQVKELRALVSNDIKNNEEISKLFSGYENEANKVIKGVEVFLEKRIKSAKKVEESVVKTWEDVLKKVQKKVDDKKREVEQEMQEYYNSYIEEEVTHVEGAIKRMEGFADDAQADLGMDYAWLEDVTVGDWTRYHDLARTAKRWGDVYRSVFNSTHPELLSNDVVFALENVQATLQDIRIGFDHVLGDLERQAERIFKGDHTAEDVPGLGEEEVVTQGEAAEQATPNDEDVPVLGLGGGLASATPVVHHEEL